MPLFKTLLRIAFPYDRFIFSMAAFVSLAVFLSQTFHPLVLIHFFETRTKPFTDTSVYVQCSRV